MENFKYLKYLDIRGCKIDNDQISKLKNQINLNPGMAVTVFIINDSRAFISYLFSPIIDSAYKAFREE